MKTIFRKTITALLGLTLVYIAADSSDFRAKAGDTTVLVTEYADLWNSNITVKTGDTVKWYVNVPEGTEPRGCGATIKIPDLGFGTDSHNKEEGHITLAQGENYIYEFTPEEDGDILFTCWMGSGCHHNYIHVTADGTYNAEKPSDAEDVSVRRIGGNAEVSFTAPAAPEGARITGYKIFATDETGKRKKAIVKESPAVFEGLDETQSYSFRVITLATSGDSAGENETVLEALSKPEETEPSTVSETQSAVSENTTTAVTEGKQPEPEFQKIITEYEDLWTGNITVKAGIPVKWYVNVPEGTELLGCERTVKIPGFGFGTDSNNKNEGHITLEEGENFIYEFTPEQTGDLLFTCWMGSECHYNYIHVTADGIADPDAQTGGRKVMVKASETSAVTTTVTSVTTSSAPAENTASDNNASSPKTGVPGVGAAELALGLSLLICFASVRSKRKND